MARSAILLGAALALLVPAMAFAQEQDRIAVLSNFGTLESGEPFSIYGKIASLSDGASLVMQIYNPNGDLCQIQQLDPLPNGVFVTGIIPLDGRICGIVGLYEVKLFYGDYSDSTLFGLVPEPYSEGTDDQKVQLARELLLAHAQAIEAESGTLPDVSTRESDIAVLRESYVTLWVDHYDPDLLYEVDPVIRPAASSLLDSVSQLLLANEITFEMARSLDRSIYTAIFHNAIGEKAESINKMYDAYTSVQNLNPEKIAEKRPLTFQELEERLLHLMTKTGTILSSSVKEEVAYIFSRGIGPLHTDDLQRLIDMVGHGRFLDVISRNESQLYSLIRAEWELLRLELSGTSTVESLLKSQADLGRLYDAAILLRMLDDVREYAEPRDGDPGELANLILPEWTALKMQLERASSVQHILNAEQDVTQMVKVIEISSRISKSVEISRTVGLSSGITSGWQSMLDRVEAATTVDEILVIVSEFEDDITELREKRSPLDVLELQYTEMRQTAELQADYGNLQDINDALKVIAAAKDLRDSGASQARVDRIEVLLTWASEMAPAIQQELDSYGKSDHDARAGDILRRAKSLEDLIDLSVTAKRFLPNYLEFVDDMKSRLYDARNLVIAGELKQADSDVDRLFDEWHKVSEAYAEDPHGSEVGYSLDELRRIELRDKIAELETAIDNFGGEDFEEYEDGYVELEDEAQRLIEIANFVDAERKVTEMGDYLSEFLARDSPRIMYELTQEVDNGIWTISGATDKSAFDRRENIYVTVHHLNMTKHSELRFTDTRQGVFDTRWEAPTDPGLYVVELQFQDTSSTRLVHIEEDYDADFTESDLDMADLARDFGELESFIKEFGGPNADHGRIDSARNGTATALIERDPAMTKAGLDELKAAIERYLPVRSREAVIEASFDGLSLALTGAVQKGLIFSEDLFVDIYDQRGERVMEVALKDDSFGAFEASVPTVLQSGLYVAELEYHDIKVSDFFNVE